jgi:signal peptidase II
VLTNSVISQKITLNICREYAVYEYLYIISFRMKTANTSAIKNILNQRWIKILLFSISSLSLISWDRVSKELAKEHLKDKPGYSYFHDSFRLLYVENTGAAMSLGDQLSGTVGLWVLGIIPLVFLIGLFIYAVRRLKKLSFGKLLAFSLILAGGIGNIMDRLLYDRHVTDFMNLGIMNLRTGIFNFADVWITTGVIYFIFARRKTGNPKHPDSGTLLS